MIRHYILFLTLTTILINFGCTDSTATPTPRATATTLLTLPTATTTATATRVVVVSPPALTPTITATTKPTPTPANVETTPASALILWHNLPPAQAAQLQVEVTQFSLANPASAIELRRYEGAETLAANIIDERAEFDIILGSTTLLSPLQQTGQLRAIDTLFPSRFINTFAPNLLEGVSDQSHLWGVPDTAGFHLLLFYNTEFVAQPPANTADLIALAQQLQTDERAGLMLNSQDPLWLLPWLWAYGGWIVDEQGLPNLNTPEMIQALELHLSWHQGDKAISPLLTYNEARNLFRTGKAAMMLEGEWAIGELSQPALTGAESPLTAWNVALLPALSDGVRPPQPLILGRYWAVSADLSGAEIQTATTFLNFITQPERQINWANDFGLLPTQQAALANPVVNMAPYLGISARQVRNGISVPLHTNLNAILEAMREPLRQLLANDLTSAEAAALMQQPFE